jgi:hydroxymethylglutaryl-CoA lyase
MNLSTTDLPKQVTLRENGPREGFQMHAEFIPTDRKLALIEALADTGVAEIEVTSFVRPDRVPQLKDAEDLVGRLKPASNFRYTALYLNEKGLLRNLQFPVLAKRGSILLAASEEFLKRNSNQTIDAALAEIPRWLALFKEHALPFEQLMISTAFGDSFAGKISAEKTLSVVRRALELCSVQPEEVTFADTTGWGDPNGVITLISDFRSTFPKIEVGLHLHDTRGTGMANVYAGLLCGVTRFDTSVGGLGGCPFAPGAAGNVPTEDVAHLCETLGIKTGINFKKLITAAKLAEEIVQRKLPGKLKDAN